MKNVATRLASSSGRRDEAPNIALATEIAASNNKEAVSGLFDLLRHKDKAIQNDSIKVIYEIGERNPRLIAGFTAELVSLLHHKNNRLQWGAMTALDALTNEQPDMMHAALPHIIAAADKGSVITHDHCVNILIKLCAVRKYADTAYTLLNERLKTGAPNQLPMYAEKALPALPDKHRPAFAATLTARLDDMEKESKRLRLEKVIRKINTSGRQKSPGK